MMSTSVRKYTSRLSRSLFITRIKGFFPQPLLVDRTVTFEEFANYLKIMMVKVRHISQRLSESDKRELSQISEIISRGEGNHEDLKQQANVILEKLQILPFRKMKISSKIYRDQDDLKLVKNLRKNLAQIRFWF